MTRTRISLVATVLNEYGSLPAWIDGLKNQTRYPDECIVVDGGSSDGTLELLEAVEMPFPLKVISAPSVNISTGRNIAISSAVGEIVVVTDAGTVAETNWIDLLVRPFEADCSTDLVAGFFEPQAGTFWTRTLGATTLPDASEINHDLFLASSRSFAFRRGWFDWGFQYPEWLDYCEDVVFDLLVRRAGARQICETGAVVRFSPRGGAISFVRQYYRYARGDGKAGLFLRRHLVRYGTYIVALAVLCRRRPIELAIASLAGMAYLRSPIIRYRQRYPQRSTASDLARAIPLMAVQRFIGDVAKMAGYPAGLLWRNRKDGMFRFWKTGWRSRRPDGSLPGA
ncbi:MAG: glycosyltransferase [Thermomicrobiales bacterium]